MVFNFYHTAYLTKIHYSMNYVFQNCDSSLYLKSMIGPRIASALCVLTFCIQGSFSTGVETDRYAPLRPYPKAFGIKHLDKEEKESEGPYCPTASDILPCICIPHILEVPVLVTLECTNVNSEQLATVFQQDFPVQNMFELKISDSPEPLTLNFSTNGVSFESIDIYNIGLLDIQEEFFAASFDRLVHLSIEDAESTVEGFPFSSLPRFQVLHTLDIISVGWTLLPTISSSSLTAITIESNDIESIIPG